MAFTVPSPRAPLDSVVQWYASELGWAAVPGPPVALPTGLRFDVLELPVDAGFAVLRRVPRTGPVAVAGSRMQLLVAAGSADELPGLLDWLEWGGITLDLTAIGAHGRITAPAPPARFSHRGPPAGCDPRAGARGRTCPARVQRGREGRRRSRSGAASGRGGNRMPPGPDGAYRCGFPGSAPGNQRNQPLAFS